MVIIDRLNDLLEYSSSILVFVGLYVVMLLFGNLISQFSKDVQQVAGKLRFQAHGIIFSLTSLWLFLDLSEFPNQIIFVRIALALTLFFINLFILDFFNYAFFDYIYPRRYGVGVPQIVSNLIRGVYVLGIFLTILWGIFHIDIRPFLTTSAVLGAIIGLALQDSLGNLFSGFALLLSKPFDIGHWIQFDKTEGLVVKIDWRSTTIKTREEDYMMIPNSQLGKVELINYSEPTKIHGQYVDVGVRYEYPPGKVKRILNEAALSTEGVFTKKKPDIFLVKYNDFSIDYRMRFYVNDYRSAPAVRSAVMEQIWYSFSRNDIDIPFPIRDVYMKEEKKRTYDDLIPYLTKIDFLEGLNDEELRDVAARLKQVLYSPGEKIIAQGEMGNNFYILRSGRVKIAARNQSGEVFLSKELDSGTFFGEISVLTGEVRTADVIAIEEVELLMLNKTDFELLLNKYPNMDKHISEKIAARQKHTFEQMELSQSAASESDAKNKAAQKVESLSQQILSKIRRFFSREKRSK